MSAKLKALTETLKERLGDNLLEHTIDYGELTISVVPDRIVEVGHALAGGDGLDFRQLVDLSGVDYLKYGQADWITLRATAGGFSRGVARGQVQVEEAETERFAVVYHLLSLTLNQRLRVVAHLSADPPRLPSVIPVWPGAEWYEREAFDLFGILFEGHPDLRRLLTDYGFIGHPFRKDFPLEGYVEVRYDPDRARVIYQPVSIENRTLVPRVIREDNPIGRGPEPKEAAADA